MSLEHYFDRIDAYASGELDVEQRAAFERELQENADLRQAQALYRLSLEAVEVQIGQEWHQTFSKWADEGAETTAAPRIRRLPRAWVAAAAAIVVLGVVGVLRFYLPPSSTPDFYQQYYQLPSATELRGAPASAGTDPFTEGRQSFFAHEYTEAIALLQRVPANTPNYSMAQYLLGHAYVQVKKFDPAQQAFEQVAVQGDPLLREKAEWQLLLICLRQSANQKSCQNQLSRIAQEPEHSFFQQAQTIQRELR